MKKYTITRIWKGVKETKFGSKPSVALQVKEHGEKWLSTFKVTPVMDSWSEGDEVEIYVTEKNGYLNFDTTGGGGGVPSDVIERIGRLEKAVFGSNTEKTVDISEPANSDKDFEF